MRYLQQSVPVAAAFEVSGPREPPLFVVILSEGAYRVR